MGSAREASGHVDSRITEVSISLSMPKMVFTQSQASALIEASWIA